jgi:2-iminobutanoate/2-iminopropanoate deaminase
MSANRRYIFSRSLFQSSAPFSHIVIAGETGYVSGIIGQRRDTGALVDPDTRAQARAMFDNLEMALNEAGFGFGNLVATRLYLLDYADFDAINEVYRERLSAPFPARTTLQVAALPLGARVQIDATIDASQTFS